MNKQEFIIKLRNGLSSLPQSDVEERLDFYSEMIDDLIEEGLSEESAVGQVGNGDDIISQILSEAKNLKNEKVKSKPKKKMKAWEIALLVLGSPIWVSLLLAALAVLFSLYVVLWSVIISLWAISGSLVACALGLILAGVGFAIGANALTGIAVIGAGIVCAGSSIFLFFGCRAATKGALLLTKKIALGIKKNFTKKEEA